MATASSPQRLRPVSLWRRPLLVGVCFGLGYGLTQRLLDLRLPGLVQWGQSFDVRQMPGEGLEKLRLRVGGEAQELRGRLDLEELEATKAAPAEQPGDTTAAPEEPIAGVATGDQLPQTAAPQPVALPPPPAESRQAGDAAATSQP
ncbi:MAG: hypothetical protein FJ077_15475 [Cyanobacteria bacterium K_DeepCast_35m_m2_023]|nr:hypothetical protein [Cyanobacteria bacterium K_DeepCast_35m_m2_023]